MTDRAMSQEAGHDLPLTESAARMLTGRILANLSPAGAQVAILSSVAVSSTFDHHALGPCQDDSDMSIVVSDGLGEDDPSVVLNLTDDGALRGAADRARELSRIAGRVSPPQRTPRSRLSIAPTLWSDSALKLLDPELRASVAQMIRQVVLDSRCSLLGNIRLSTNSITLATGWGEFNYGRASRIRLNLSARTADGQGAGWAGWVGESWPPANLEAVARQAVDRAEWSQTAVALEPGRYDTILEPEAVGQLISCLSQALDVAGVSEGRSPFSDSVNGSKVGHRIIDERLSLYEDPADPLGGFIPMNDEGEHFSRVVWIENGVLRELAENSEYHGPLAPTAPTSSTLMLTGGTTSIDEMVAATRRGILVRRFASLTVTEERSLTVTGVTRDGTALIENGRITKPIRNLRMHDSPLILLAEVAALGAPSRVFSAPSGAVAPALKVRSMNFSSLSDAI